MQIRKKLFYILCLLYCVSCDDLNLGMKYNKLLITQKENTQIYCYHLAWGFNGGATFLSTNKDVCIGFDSTKDICFGGVQDYDFFYEMKNDTLNLYSYYTPTIPKKFPVNVRSIILGTMDLPGYEDKFKQGKISKLVFDTLYNIPCEVVPDSSSYNIKFESK